MKELKYDIGMEVKLCKKHKKYFDTEVRIMLGQRKAIYPEKLLEFWDEASKCTKCIWKTSFGEWKLSRVPSEAIEIKKDQTIEDDETAEEYEPEKSAQKRIGERLPRRLNSMRCYDCHKKIDTRKEIFLKSNPKIFGLRVRCLDCGKRFQRTLKAEWRERWVNLRSN